MPFKNWKINWKGPVSIDKSESLGKTRRLTSLGQVTRTSVKHKSRARMFGRERMYKLVVLSRLSVALCLLDEPYGEQNEFVPFHKGHYMSMKTDPAYTTLIHGFIKLHVGAIHCDSISGTTTLTVCGCRTQSLLLQWGNSLCYQIQRSFQICGP